LFRVDGSGVIFNKSTNIPKSVSHFSTSAAHILVLAPVWAPLPLTTLEAAEKLKALTAGADLGASRRHPQ